MRKAFRVLLCAAALTMGGRTVQAEVLGVALASDTNPFYIAMRKGIENRAKELGWTVRVVTANEDVNAQVNGVLDLVAQKVDGILISPIDGVATGAAYEAAAKAKIPIISVARGAKSPHQTLFVSMDEKQIGRDIVGWLAKAIGGKGKVAMIGGPGGAATFKNIEAGIDEALAQFKDMKVVFRKNVALTREEGLREAEDILVAHPDVRAIYAANDELALGAVQAAVAAGKKKDVVISGMNGIPPAVASVAKGELDLTVQLNPVAWGTLGVDTMAGWLKGQRPSQQVFIKHVMIDKTNAEQAMPPKK